MQNSDANHGVASSSFKNRRPNILRKKAKHQPANLPTNITKHHQVSSTIRILPKKPILPRDSISPVITFTSDALLIQPNDLNITILQDTVLTDLTGVSSFSHSDGSIVELTDTNHSLNNAANGGMSYVITEANNTLNAPPSSIRPHLYSSDVESPLVAGFDDIFLNDGMVINKSKGAKTFPRKRWPSQKIILDTYVCDKKRLAKQNQAPVTTSVIPEFPVPEYPDNVFFADDNFPEDSSSLNIRQEVAAREISTPEAKAVGEAEECEGSVNPGGPLDPALALPLLRGLPEEPQLLVEGAGGAQALWLCPVPDCNRLYSQKDALYHHILTHFDLNIYACNTEGCNTAFISQDQLDEHHLEYHQTFEDLPEVDEGEVEDGAVLAAEDFPMDPSTELAIDQKKRARKLVTEALASVGVTEDLVASELLPDGTRSWACPQPECELSFKTHYLLKNHILAHYDLRPFKCSHAGCDWAFRALGKLRLHALTHAGLERHSCVKPGCRKAFSTKYNLQVHVMRAHTGRGGRLQCPARSCEMLFAVRTELETHLNTEHVPQHAVNRCGICGKRFWWTAGLAAHARTHAHQPGDLLCYWPGCGRRFPQPCRLRYHLRTHTGDKPYRCTYPSCNWAFPSASKLRRHARAHAGAGARRHTCAVCGRSFLRAEHLREHQPRHLPHRHHACDHPGCDEKFSNKSSVYVHKKRQHGVDGVPKVPRTKKPKGKVLVEEPPPMSIIQEPELCAEELLSLRSARTHVPWGPLDLPQGVAFLPHQPPHLLQHLSGCDEKQGNPLVCGGLELEGEGEGDGGMGGAVGAELCLGDGGDVGDDVEAQGLDLNINSLLMQEELSDGILYATEDEAALQVLLLNEDPGP